MITIVIIKENKTLKKNDKIDTFDRDGPQQPGPKQRSQVPAIWSPSASVRSDNIEFVWNCDWSTIYYKYALRFMNAINVF